MSCRRALDMELLDFLADPRSEGFRSFREHYPRCSECAAEVRAWTELHEALAAEHPAPELLARYDALAAGERSSVDAHTRRCASCREELAQLASFDPERLTAAGAVPRRAAGSDPRGRASALREWLAGLGRILWHPAFAYGLVAVLVFPLLYRNGGPLGGELRVEDYDLAQKMRPRSEVEVWRAAQPEAVVRVAPERVRAARDELAELEARTQVLARVAELPAEQKAPIARKKEPASELAAAAEGRADAPAPFAAEGRAHAPAPSAPPKAVKGEAIARSLPSTATTDTASAAKRSHEAAPRMPAAARMPPTESAVGAFSQSLAYAGRREEPDSPLLPLLAAGPPTELALAPEAKVLSFRLPVPAEAPAEAEAEVRITSPDGRRELLERLRIPAAATGSRELVVELPRAWLTPGVHLVELRVRGLAGEPRRFSFRAGG